MSKRYTELFEKEKHPKSEAEYVGHPVKGQKCFQCTMWVEPNACTAVKGKISPNGWCKWWEHKK